MAPVTKTIESIQFFLDPVLRWAAGQEDIQAIAMVGSYARGAAREDSDIDLVILSDDPQKYLADTAWVRNFGTVSRQQIENYGKLTSLRVWYEQAPEVEFGLTQPDWAALPIDEGTLEVIRDGIRVLYERKPVLSQPLKEIETRQGKSSG